VIPVHLIPADEFQRVIAADLQKNSKLAIIADMCRANALSAVKRAKSGHLGSTLSAMDIVVRLYYEEMNVVSLGMDNVDRDIYFSSKGHDVPGQYSVLFSLGIIPQDKLMRLRRLEGLDGHPDIRIPGIEANSGSLGMGISKAKGMAWGKKKAGRKGRLFVLTGDGEFQEGQNYEALQSVRHHNICDLTVIIDHNKLQSDKPVNEIISLGNLEDQLASFGWYVTRCDGNNQNELEKVFLDLKEVTGLPKVLIADTIKGKGVSFMEHPHALIDGKGCYPWHSGAPSDEKYFAAYEEIAARINSQFAIYGLGSLVSEEIGEEGTLHPSYSLEGEPLSPGAPVVAPPNKVSDEYVADAYGKALVELAGEFTDFVVLDADLSSDCRTREFEINYPDRFIENGIAEQDMVSTAGGIAIQGLLPIVNSFASFLASRANEQIYNNASEETKIIYVCHYAGLIPAGPGKSHQSIRDISLFGALPNCLIMQPCNAKETEQLLRFAIAEAQENCMIRLIIGPSPRRIKLPKDYNAVFGQGIDLCAGEAGILFAYGPVMLHEALLASELLAEKGIGLKVVNIPWLNRIDRNWLASCIESYSNLFILEDHASVGGLSDFLTRELIGLGALAQRRLNTFAIEGYPACGTPSEVLKYHGLDGVSLAYRIEEVLG
jgi:transketolase